MMRVDPQHSSTVRELLTLAVRFLAPIYRFVCRIDALLIGGLMTFIVSVISVSVAIQGKSFIDGHHPGNMLNGALHLLHGEPLISRVQSIYGLFIPYLNALQLYVFGESYLSLWVLPIIVFSWGLTVYYLLFKRFLRPLESLIAVFIILALNIPVLLPWSNYVAFGLNGTLLWLLSRNIEHSAPRLFALFGIGALLFISVLVRTQAILLFPMFLILLFLYGRDNWLPKVGALSFGFFLLLAGFVLKLVHDGTLKDYYLQTVAIQDRMYFGEDGPFLGVRQIFEVFALGKGTALPNPGLGFAPFNLFGSLWLCIFMVSAFIVIQFGVRLLSSFDRYKVSVEFPPTVLAIAMLTSIGPLFSLHNVWDNFRYALHMTQGIGIIFYAVDRSFGREYSRAAILTSAFFFFAPLYSVYGGTKASVRNLLARVQDHRQIKYAKYFEGMDIAENVRERLDFARDFFEAYSKKYPDSYIYTEKNAITDGIYAIGKFPTYDKTLTNDHFSSTYALYYPEFATKFDEAARSRKLIFLTSSGADTALKKYDYVIFCDFQGLVIYIAKERAENFSMPLSHCG